MKAASVRSVRAVTVTAHVLRARIMGAWACVGQGAGGAGRGFVGAAAITGAATTTICAAVTTTGPGLVQFLSAFPAMATTTATEPLCINAHI